MATHLMCGYTQHLNIYVQITHFTKVLSMDVTTHHLWYILPNIQRVTLQLLLKNYVVVILQVS